MRRIILSALFATTASPTFAEDYYHGAPVIAATVYQEAAKVTQQVSLDIPAGRHRVLVPLGFDELENFPRFLPILGLEILGVAVVLNQSKDKQDVFTPLQSSVFVELEDLEDRVRAKEDQIAQVKLTASALMAQKRFVAAIRSPSETPATVEELKSVSEYVLSANTQVLSSIEENRLQLREFQDDLDELNEELEVVKNWVKQIIPDERPSGLLALSVNAATAINSLLEFTYYIDSAGWTQISDIWLTDADSPKIQIDRNILVTNNSQLPWSDIVLTVSTLDPFDSVGPSFVPQQKALIYTPEPEPVPSDVGSYVEPVMEAPVIIEETSSAFSPIYADGLSVSYTLPYKVTLLNEEFAYFPLGQFTFDAERLVHAVPRTNDTAYVMARFKNTSGEPFIGGLATMYRDGHFAGSTQIDPMPAGAEATLPFGPMEGIRLDTIFVENNTGGSGFISKSDTREQSIILTLENLTADPQDVRAFYGMAYSEQDDLQVTARANPQPSETNVDDRRGITAWDLLIEPGEKSEIRLDFSMNWPEGQMLNWRP